MSDNVKKQDQNHPVVQLVVTHAAARSHGIRMWGMGFVTGLVTGALIATHYIFKDS